MSVQIRLATSEDYPAIDLIGRETQEIHVQGEPTIFRAGTSGISDEYVRQFIEDPQLAVYVAESAGEVVGYLFLEVRQRSFLDMLLPQLVAKIRDIAVKETMRGKGVGYQLFETAAAWARGKQAERMELNVWEFNGDARAFYERQGMHTLTRTMSMKLS